MVAAISGFTGSKYGSTTAQSSRDIANIDCDAMNKLGNMMVALHNGGADLTQVQGSFIRNTFINSIED